jgi:phytoene dehydrogenase-like protein
VPETYDIVVAGGGHNSLIAAAYLAKAGNSICVLDGRSILGGDTATEELTLPGFRHDTCSTAHNLIQANPALRELELERYGLEYIQPDPVVHIPFPDGTWLTMWRDFERTCDEFAKFSKRDADAFRKMMAEYGEVKGVFSAARHTPIGFGPSLQERLAEHPRWQRRVQMSAWEAIQDRFEDWHTRAWMLWMAMMTVQPPDRPGTGLLAWSLAYGRTQHSWTLPRGGSGELPAALSRLLEEHGATLLPGKKVASLVLEGDRCAGVETEDGERYLARKAVLSTIHVKHLVEMAPAERWGDLFVEGVAEWRAGVSMFVTHYATTEPPLYEGTDGPIASVASGTAHSVDVMLGKSAQFARGRVDTETPDMLIVCPTVADPDRAPDGHHTLKVIGFQPYELAEGPERWEELKEEVSAANLDYLRTYAPNLTDDKILATLIKSPVDLEALNPHNWHGSCHGGDMGPAQSGALRPVAGWAQHRMPIAGLYQTGSTTHPGASVSGAPGRNAALVMLQDFGMSIDEIVGQEAAP